MTRGMRRWQPGKDVEGEHCRLHMQPPCRERLQSKFGEGSHAGGQEPPCHRAPPERHAASLPDPHPTPAFRTRASLSPTPTALRGQDGGKPSWLPFAGRTLRQPGAVAAAPGTIWQPALHTWAKVRPFSGSNTQQEMEAECQPDGSQTGKGK